MSATLAEQLNTQFYTWEKYGRGWFLYDVPVDLEPPFEPFFCHAVPTPVIDDGKRPTILSTVADFLKGKKNNSLQTDIVFEEIPRDPYAYESDAPLEVLSITLPKDQKLSSHEIEQILLMLSYTTCPVSFEIIATATSIKIQFVYRSPDAVQVVSQVKAYIPTAILQDRSETAFDIIKEGKQTMVVDFGLSDEFMRPLEMLNNLNLDPLVGLIGSLGYLENDEQAAIQVLFKGAVNPWAESIMRAVMDNQGGPFFEDAPDMVPLAKEKISSPFFAVTLRVIGQAETGGRAFAITQQVGKALVRLYSSKSNTLIPLVDNGYDPEDHMNDVLLRQSRRLGMLLNSKELATLVHLPSPSVVSTKLERNIRKTKAAPDLTKNHDFILGTNYHQGIERTVSLSSNQRLKHTHIIGATGTGKSTLLLNLIVEDIEQGNGIAVLDPHGDLIENVLSFIPPNRINDVLLIDPSDSEFPVSFNILQAHSEIEKEILSSDLVAVFKRLSTSWGDQMNSVFANAILAFLESTQGGTLTDLRRFLVEKSYRDTFLKTVTDPNIIYYWQKEYPILRTNSIGSILTRLDTFLRPKVIRNMVSQKKGIDFEQLMDKRKIILVKLSQGLIGAENSYLLGTVIVSKIYQAAMARQAKPIANRSDFFLYIDEFQNFICPSMSGILSGARKYHLGLILAHQDMAQLQKNDSELASSVISNAGTRICFRVGDNDAKKFADGFSFFDSKDLQDLNTGEAIARIDRPDFDFNLEIKPLQEPDKTKATLIQAVTIAKSREQYATERSEVEQFLKEAYGVENIKDEPPVVALEPKSEVKVVTTPPTIPTQTIEVQDTSTKENLVKREEQSQHRYLQTLIKRMAGDRGFKAVLEEPTPDGKGRVDVSLERNGKRIAIEISVTTTDEWELHNIEKCFAAGFETVIVCSTEKRSLDKINKQVQEKLVDNLKSKVLLFEPEALFLYLDHQVAAEANTETKVKGYRVKVEYSPQSNDVSKQKKENILKTITKSKKKK